MVVWIVCCLDRAYFFNSLLFSLSINVLLFKLLEIFSHSLTLSLMISSIRPLTLTPQVLSFWNMVKQRWSKVVLEKPLPSQSFSMKRGIDKLKESFGFTEGDNFITENFPVGGCSTRTPFLRRNFIMHECWSSIKQTQATKWEGKVEVSLKAIQVDD